MFNHSPPGNKVASPSSKEGIANYVVHSSGTSNAAALLSRSAVHCYSSLIDILQEQASNIDYQRYIPSLLKAMLIHGSSWRSEANLIGRALRKPNSKDQQIDNLIKKWLGYGMPNIKRVLACTEQRASLLGFGELYENEAHVFKLPLPPSLESRREWRRITVTLAWLSPIAPTTHKYRGASLWFKLENNTVATDREIADWQSVKRGTVQHEIFEGIRAVSYSDDGTLEIKVNCAKDAAKIERPIPYGLVVSFEVKEGIDISVYNEIRQGILSTVQIRQKTI